MRVFRYFGFSVSLALMVSCGGRKPALSGEFGKLTSEFVFFSLALSPVNATGAGYHVHQGVRLDEQLDDISESGIAKQRRFYEDMRGRLSAANQKPLSADDRADSSMMQDQIGLNLLELDTIQSYKHNPALYVELIGNALFNPLVLEYAPKPQRLKHIVARLEKIPAFVENAKNNLVDAPEVWNRVAREENEGNISLIDKTLRAQMPGDIAASFDQAASKALVSLKGLNQWLAADLSKRPSDWRLGKDRYAKKFKHGLGMDVTPEQLLGDAEASLESTRQKMFEVSKPLYARLTASPPGDLNQVVSAVLAGIAGKHSTPETFIADARRDLDEVRRFVREHSLLTLPLRSNLQVIETPEFMRGIYGVGGFSAAPALEPHLGAFYWITPIPETWPQDRIESKLREYNYYGLKLLTIHEAMPGHYVQLEHANDIQPAARRLLRSVFGNTPYIEGWAVYATGMMLDQGYLDNSVELRLTFLKQQLRMIANAILDVRLQTMDMSDEEAMRLMMDRTFQEKEEATAKLQRAKLSSVQLPTYFAGYREWVKLRQAYFDRKRPGDRLSDFHDQALKYGAVPMRVLASLMAK
ncbi:MAG TPA: DUF885 domain-containing protein [Bryobacteraceae bacterium]|nr:DUF885 domain-containing protein [Bryobacteraceae bacterium]